MEFPDLSYIILDAEISPFTVNSTFGVSVLIPTLPPDINKTVSVPIPTSKEDKTDKLPLALIEPFIVNSTFGISVFIPTLPADINKTVSVPIPTSKEDKTDKLPSITPPDNGRYLKDNAS